jgi:hypothetical protein
VRLARRADSSVVLVVPNVKVSMEANPPSPHRVFMTCCGKALFLPFSNACWTDRSAHRTGCNACWSDCSAYRTLMLVMLAKYLIITCTLLAVHQGQNPLDRKCVNELWSYSVSSQVPVSAWLPLAKWNCLIADGLRFPKVHCVFEMFPRVARYTSAKSHGQMKMSMKSG